VVPVGPHIDYLAPHARHSSPSLDHRDGHRRVGK
jgi:hypothetical protein